jgi:hypothetical protein
VIFGDEKDLRDKEYAMSNVLRKQGVLDFIDSYKYDSEAMLEDLRQHPAVEKQLQDILHVANRMSQWPSEFRNWKAALLGLLANEIGGIAHPMLRERAAEDLFKTAGRLGFTRSMINMICGEIYQVRIGLQGMEIDIPQDMRGPGEHDGEQ